VLNRVAGLSVLDRWGVRRPAERAVYHSTKTGFRTAGAVNRTFHKMRASGAAARPSAAPGTGVFDLDPTEDQQMMVQVVRDFAADVLSPAAAKAEAATEPSSEVLGQANELGVTLMSLPEELGGLSAERSATTGVLVGEALAHGDMGLAVACLAPTAVATAISLWGSAEQQQTYLSAFTGDEVPAAALTIAEPRPLFDPQQLRTTATKVAGGYTLTGVKSGVVRGAAAELFIVATAVAGAAPALFVVESSTPGVRIEAEPSMGLRAAGLSRLLLEDVVVGADALLGTAVPTPTPSVSGSLGSPGARSPSEPPRRCSTTSRRMSPSARRSANRLPTASRSRSASPTSPSSSKACDWRPTARLRASTRACRTPAKSPSPGGCVRSTA